MKNLIVLLIVFSLFTNIFAQSNNTPAQKKIIVGGIVESITRLDEPCYYNCKLKNISVIYGNWTEDTITVKINPCATTGWYLRKGEQVILTAELINNTYETYREDYNFSPFYSVFVIDSLHLKLYESMSYDSLVLSYTNYFNETRTFGTMSKAKSFLKYIYNPHESLVLRQFAIFDLKTLYTEDCLPFSYIDNVCNKLYNDTSLNVEIRETVTRRITGHSYEQRFFQYDYNVEQESYYYKKEKSNLEYFIPLWKKGLLFCDSMINKYETIIKDVPHVKDTISLADDSNLFFTGKIKKVNKNELLISNPKFFTGEYLKDKITVKADIDTLFEKTIEGENVLVQASLVNDKYIIKLSDQNGFNKPALTPDGTNLYILSKDNLLKYSIKIKPDELLDVISKYYSDLNSEIITKDQKLVNYINKGKYLFIRQRSLWEFSDLTLEYDSLCWDYNRKYNLLDSLINTLGRYKAPPLPIIVTADLLFTKSFNQNYSSKYNTNIYELDYSSNLAPIIRYQEFLKSGDLFAKEYAMIRFQDIIKYYQNIKNVLTHRLIVYEN
jgi:hypothetical protein